MRSRHPFPLVFLVLVCCVAMHYAQVPFQKQRLFDNVCNGCVVAKGIGFQSFAADCSCYYTCELVRSHKLSSMASDYVSHKRCCGCGETFSKKLITCVNYYDKRSDCFNGPGANPCAQAGPNMNIPRESGAAVVGPLSKFCSGFSTCVEVGGELVPEPKCCPDGECYDPGTGMCSTPACGTSPACTELRENEKDDCECDMTEAPKSECPFTDVDGQITKFMGIEEMVVYDCPHGTCWDEALCQCVMTNNTGYHECNEYVDLEFDEDLFARDAKGNIIYTTVHNNVTNENMAAQFYEGSINVVGTANAWLSNELIIHFEFDLEDESGTSGPREECIVGNCKRMPQTSGGTDTFAIEIERNADLTGSNLTVFFEYQDRIFMNLQGSMADGNLGLSYNYLLDTEYEFWFIYCGDEEVAYAGILEQGTGVVAEVRNVTGSVQLLGSQTGFLFGDCRRGHEFEGTLDEVEIYRNCKPEDDAEFEAAFEEIIDELD